MNKAQTVVIIEYYCSLIYAAIQDMVELHPAIILHEFRHPMSEFVEWWGQGRVAGV